MRDSLAFQILLLGTLASLGTYVWGVEPSLVSVFPNPLIAGLFVVLFGMVLDRRTAPGRTPWRDALALGAGAGAILGLTVILLGVQAFQDGSGFLLAASFAMSVGGTIFLGLVAAGGLVVCRRLAER